MLCAFDERFNQPGGPENFEVMRHAGLGTIEVKLTTGHLAASMGQTRDNFQTRGIRQGIHDVCQFDLVDIGVLDLPHGQNLSQYLILFYSSIIFEL